MKIEIIPENPVLPRVSKILLTSIQLFLNEWNFDSTERDPHQNTDYLDIDLGFGTLSLICDAYIPN